jgi:hypothetical protein
MRMYQWKARTLTKPRKTVLSTLPPPFLLFGQLHQVSESHWSFALILFVMNEVKSEFVILTCFFRFLYAVCKAMYV